MRFRKKPLVVEAILYNGINEPEIIQWLKPEERPLVLFPRGVIGCLKVKTFEGTTDCSVGDYLIRGVKGELYPCKPHVFEQTYEPHSDPRSNEETAKTVPIDGAGIFGTGI